jgi:transcriptional regulator GlxA family with amidase domain
MQSNQQPVIQAVFIMLPQVHLLDITGPAHIFYEATCYGAPVKLLFSSIFSNQTDSISSSTLAFQQLTPYDQLVLRPGDLVFVPGLESSLLTNNEFLLSSMAFQHWLTDQHSKGVIICSVCTGAFLLAESGLLNGRTCTTHWKYTERFKQRYPKVILQTNRLFIQEDKIYTSAGVASGIDLALYMIEQLWGAQFAAKIGKEVVIYFRRSIDDPQLSVFTMYRNHLEDRVHTVQDMLSQTLDHKFSVDELADKVNMSSRNLTRLFKTTTGITIGNYVDKLRIEHANHLIDQGHTLQATALHCGLKSTNQLRHLLNHSQLAKTVV